MDGHGKSTIDVDVFLPSSKFMKIGDLPLPSLITGGYKLEVTIWAVTKIPSSQCTEHLGDEWKGSSQKLLISDSGKVEFCPLLEDSGLFKQKRKIKDVPSGNLLQFAIENGDLVRGFTPLIAWWIFPVRYVNVYQRVTLPFFKPSR